MEPGEDIIAGAPCLPRGAIKTRAAGSVFGVAGNAIAAHGTRIGHDLAGESLPSIIALGVTQIRLLVFAMNGFTGRPNRVLYAIPLSEISGVRASQGRSVGMKILQLDIVFNDQACLELDVPREHMKSGQRVAEALARFTALLGQTV
jgi:hypothetical protein